MGRRSVGLYIAYTRIKSNKDVFVPSASQDSLPYLENSVN
jgi:hypothetical protein